MLDQIRDVILHKKGNETLILNHDNLSENNGGSTELQNFIGDIILSQANKLGGMLLKTYDSDIFNNWIKTDWIDGAGGITEITSIDITANDGKLTMDALNLQLVAKLLIINLLLYNYEHYSSFKPVQLLSTLWFRTFCRTQHKGQSMSPMWISILS